MTAIAAGSYQSYAVTAGGWLKAWGLNKAGQLGDGTTIERHAPADVPGLASGMTIVAAGGSHTCSVTPGGALKCWGLNDTGQVGDGTWIQRSAPADVTGLGSGVTAVAAGENHTCAVVPGGGLKCWGSNGNGQLGTGTTGSRNTPADVAGLTGDVIAVAAGYSHTCAVTAGAVKCWGWDSYGQLGQGTITYRTTPVDVVTWIKIYLQQLEKGA
jgi:alpha-tubulin suppressor-like RCC1 family protein